MELQLYRTVTLVQDSFEAAVNICVTTRIMEQRCIQQYSCTFKISTVYEAVYEVNFLLSAEVLSSSMGSGSNLQYTIMSLTFKETVR